MEADGVDPWTAMADPTRRALLERVADRPRPVAELADGLPMSRPAISQHLKVLKQAGLVVDHAVGTRRIYELDPSGLVLLRVYLQRFWDAGLASFKRTVEQQEQR